jgi:hypothetical protein
LAGAPLWPVLRYGTTANNSGTHLTQVLWRGLEAVVWNKMNKNKLEAALCAVEASSTHLRYAILLERIDCNHWTAVDQLGSSPPPRRQECRLGGDGSLLSTAKVITECTYLAEGAPAVAVTVTAVVCCAAGVLSTGMAYRMHVEY